jgi:hypothetical protein
MSVENNLECFAGEDVTITVTLSGSGSIAGWAFTFTLKSAYGGSALVTKTVGSGIVITDAANRILTITLSSSDTNRATTEAVKYLYDLWRTDSGSRGTGVHGVFKIKPAVLTF